ncbi:7TM-DISM domain-containing protein [Aureibacillus halotolerans]|uniref:7TM protein involved in diverse intracellular signaling n=1 Tax=Aureibacillus halotolerans TaxID=1508390 RepID=A0A4R6TRD4_9BACI|nr:7TM-DISM domain-containing protein [Aureibacillus halotolerans]TDQ36120.1 7TM protein involved in diverse intracellular signaling [Aureibacillus halotolerans]
MKRLYGLLCIACLLLTSCQTMDRNEDIPIATKGVLDLTNWSLHEEMIPLEGVWTMNWRGQDEVSWTDKTMYLPGLWFEKGLPSTGEAIFELKVLLSEKDAEQQLGLLIPVIHTAYRLLVNGQEVAHGGRPGSPSEMIAGYHVATAGIQANEENELNLRLHVSNTDHFKAGMNDAITLGEFSDIQSQSDGKLALNLLVAGILFATCVYQVATFMSLRKRRGFASLMLGLLSFGAMVRMLAVDEAYLYELLPFLSWDILMKIEYSTSYIGFAIFMLFVSALYPQESGRWFSRIAVTLLVFFSVAVIVLPASFYIQLLYGYKFVMGILSFTILYVIWKAYQNKKPMAFMSFWSTLVLLLSIGNDVLYYEGLLDTFDLVPVSVFLLIILQGINIALYHVKSIYTVEELSTHLRDMNKQLKKKVDDQAFALEKSQQEAAVALAQTVFIRQYESEATIGPSEKPSIQTLAALWKVWLKHQKESHLFTYQVIMDDPSEVLSTSSAVVLYQTVTMVTYEALKHNVRHVRIECKATDHQQHQVRILLQGLTASKNEQLERKLTALLATSPTMNHAIEDVNEHLLDVTIWNKKPMP